MTPERCLAKADRALNSAWLLLADGDIDGACNRAHYAMFDAAHAALILSDISADSAEIRTHSGLIGAFGKHLVKTNRISADLGRILNQVERMRLLADYTGEDIELERARWVVEQAATFVGAIKNTFAAPG